MIKWILLTVFFWGFLFENSLQCAQNVDEIMRAVAPYLLPEEHPAKEFLDALCSSARIVSGAQSMKDAGFTLIERKRRSLIVGKHAGLPGYLIKNFLDTHNVYGQEWELWKRRCQGRDQIQAYLDHRGYNHLFKVPRKWIYPLPAQPAPVFRGHQHQRFILVVEEMNIAERRLNESKFGNEMTAELLIALVNVIIDNGLTDSAYIGNIPFCVDDGRIAFIDTEYFNIESKKVKFDKLKKHLSSDMQKLLSAILKNKP